MWTRNSLKPRKIVWFKSYAILKVNELNKKYKNEVLNESGWGKDKN